MVINNYWLELIALSWLCYLIVSFYVNRCMIAKVPIRKPFGCQKCLGFWVGIIYGAAVLGAVKDVVIFACLVSLGATLLSGLSSYLNK